MGTTSQRFEMIIQATAAQAVAEVKKTASAIQDGFTRGKLVVAAFNKTLSGGRGAINSVTSQIRTLVGAAVGLSALAKSVKIMQDADNAAFNMSTSVAAANREFDNTGSVAMWEETVKRLSGELKIYSETSLKNAVARTVDMTKRLGLSADQMEEVIKRSADLGAGKTDLEGAIERVTAALRGEAEASEYLGLTLNENYVKAWYEASDAHARAWKDLSDLEKAQVRYNAFLAQSDQLQGRAAASADTFGGALAQVRAEVENAVTNNKDVAESLGRVADTLRSHSREIGQIASDLLSGAAAAIEFAVEYKGLLAAVAGTAVAATLISKLVALVTALNAAFAVMTGLSVVAWIGSLRLALAGCLAQTTLLSIAFKGFIAFAAAQGIYNIVRLTKALWDWRDATRELKAAQDDLAGQKAWIDPKIADKLKEISTQTGIAIKSFEQFSELRKKGVIDFDQKTGQYFKAKTPATETTTKPTGTGSGSDAKQIAEDQKQLERQLALELLQIAGAKWEALKEQAAQHYEDQLRQAHGNAQLIAQAESLYAQTLAEIEKKAADESSTGWLKNAVARMQAHVETSLAVLEDAYQRGEVSIAAYYDRRKTIIEQRAEDEIEALRRVAEAESDAAEQLRLDTEIYEKEQALYRDLLSLARERADAEKAIADAKRQTTQILNDLRIRTLPRDGGAEYTAELAELDQRHQQEIARLHELRATETQINEAFRLQQLEKDQLLADQEQRIFEQRLQNASDVFGGMSDIFENLYSLSGESQKEWFYLAKAAALAEAIVNTALAVTKALSEGGPFAGPALAAVAAASGAVQIATIASQSLADGGPVRGSSPHDKADNVPIWATANEFMQPVAAVKYYGVQAMEAIRRRLVPRELLSGFALGGLVPARPAYALASGGTVPAAPASGSVSNTEIANRVNIVNFIDPAELRRYIQSEDGSRAILNVVSSRSRQVARRLKQ